MQTIVFILFGYLSGSILYAQIFAKVFKKENMIENSKDKNPGTANAFVHGGFWCGVVTLICDVLKGFVPVFLYMSYVSSIKGTLSAMPFVIAAPVVGHAFPVFYKFKGGKGIATTFGCLLGLLPVWQPAAVLAVFFVFYSCILRISPHYHRTLAAYFCSLLYMSFLVDFSAVVAGFAIITVIVCIRMFASKEEKEKMKVRLV